ncbi:MAG: ABC transporter permease, partial [Planctomycetaceae bacterium]|nr:ABC transporter permease [Planctomycetaceae bacterium]
GTVLAMFQAFLFVLMAPLLQFVGLAPEMHFVVGVVNILGAILFLALVSLGLTALGYFFAWRMDSIQGYHSIMSVVLLPMWLLSGALFPGDDSPWMKWIIAANPLTYGVAGLRRFVSSGSDALSSMPSLPVCLAVTAGFAFVCLAADVWVTRRDQGV